MFTNQIPGHALILTTLLVAAVSPAVHAQCTTGWAAGPMSSAVPGADGPIHAMIEWSVPGLPSKLIVGGEFSHIGGIAANNIAAWDGGAWQALGAGVDGAVLCLAVYNSQLIAGGRFLSPGTRIASWNGSTWAAMGEFGPPTPDPAVAVRAMALFNGELYVAGFFCCVNGVGIPENAARYNGTNWSVAAGIPLGVYALQTVDWDGPGPQPVVLYIGGEWAFGSPSLRYTQDGLASTHINGPLGKVYALTTIDSLVPLPNSLVVGGAFTSWNVGDGDSITVHNIARIAGVVGTVLQIGSGVVGQVYALRAFGDDLYVGGYIIQAGGLSTPAIARIDASAISWAIVGGGLGPQGARVNALRVFNGELYVGGDFDFGYNAPSTYLVPAQNIAKWNTSAWQAIDQPPHVFAATALGSRLIAGGDFSHVTQATPTSPPLNRHNLLTWNGVNNDSLGLGANGTVRALTSFTVGGPFSSSNIVAGGDFSVAYGDGLNPGTPVAANRVAQWIEPQSGFAGWSAMGAGFNDNVYALERFNGETVAGGLFTMSGASSTPYLARWTGNPASWQPFGAAGINGYVYALKSFFGFGSSDPSLVIGGSFTAAPGSGVTAHRILQLNQSIVGGTWVALGEGFNGSVYAIERYGNGISARTYAAGAFTHTFSGSTQLNRIARFTGSPGAWQPVGTGVGFNSYVFALKSAGGFLYAAGAFTSVDGIPCSHIARWNGSVWAPVDGGADGDIDALASFQNELIAGGVFVSVRSPPEVSPAMARLLQSGAPWIAAQPVSITTPCNSNTAFSVTPASSYAALTYSWRHNGTPLSDGPTAHGSTISGAQTAALSIASARAADAGSYDCVITNACGSVTSNAATLAVTACCPADINHSGAVDVDDLIAVILAWGGCGNCAACPPDTNASCTVDVDDLIAVILAWGACP